MDVSHCRFEFFWNLIGCDLGFAAQPRYEILSNSEMVKK